VNDKVDTMEGHLEAIAITNVTEEEPDSRVIAPGLTHLVLLELVSGKDDYSIGVPGLKNLLEECLAERAGSTGDEERRSVEDWHGS
jgi:hypothetical protein